MQYGRALQRVLQRIYDADPKHGPVHMLKVDIADGFYRVWLSVADIPKLGVALPPGPRRRTADCVPASPPDGLGGKPPAFLHRHRDGCRSSQRCAGARGRPGRGSPPRSHRVVPRADLMRWASLRSRCGITSPRDTAAPSRTLMFSSTTSSALPTARPVTATACDGLCSVALDSVLRPLDDADSPDTPGTGLGEEAAQGGRLLGDPKDSLGLAGRFDPRHHQPAPTSDRPSARDARRASRDDISSPSESGASSSASCAA